MKAALVLMSRAPIAGETKTRLHTHLTPEESAELHKAFLKDISKKLCRIKENYSRLELYLSYTPEGSSELFAELIGDDFNYLLQRGSDLGERMFNALNDAHQKSQMPVLIMGSDLPSLPVEVITEALVGLQEKDLVIGPSEDGGYYLIGMQQPHDYLFTDHNWGKSSVLKSTLEAASNANLNPHFLPEWHDVDTFNELLFLREELLRSEVDDFYPDKSKLFLDKIFKKKN